MTFLTYYIVAILRYVCCVFVFSSQNKNKLKHLHWPSFSGRGIYELKRLFTMFFFVVDDVAAIMHVFFLRANLQADKKHNTFLLLSSVWDVSFSVYMCCLTTLFVFLLVTSIFSPSCMQFVKCIQFVDKYLHFCLSTTDGFV